MCKKSGMGGGEGWEEGQSQKVKIRKKKTFLGVRYSFPQVNAWLVYLTK